MVVGKPTPRLLVIRSPTRGSVFSTLILASNPILPQTKRASPRRLALFAIVVTLYQKRNVFDFLVWISGFQVRVL
jgi:hypothetical protein